MCRVNKRRLLSLYKRSFPCMDKIIVISSRSVKCSLFMYRLITQKY